jgi:hypothetical protein
LTAFRPGNILITIKEATPMPKFQPFVMERMMSKFEKAVDYNLSESGVHPLTLKELIRDDPDGLERLLALEMDYPHANGIPELRQNIAALYPGAGPENEFRMGAVGYGYLLQGDESVLIDNIIAGYCSLAGAFLAAYGLPTPPEEMLVSLVTNGIYLAIDLCADDYMTEVNATVDFVAAELAARGIK